MRRGTTPTHTFTTDIDLSTADVIYITYQQAGVNVLEKTRNDITFGDKAISVTLTQEETLAFNAFGGVKIQIRARFPDGSAAASQIIQTTAEAVLKEGEI